MRRLVFSWLIGVVKAEAGLTSVEWAILAFAAGCLIATGLILTVAS